MYIQFIEVLPKSKGSIKHNTTISGYYKSRKNAYMVDRSDTQKAVAVNAIIYSYYYILSAMFIAKQLRLDSALHVLIGGILMDPVLIAMAMVRFISALVEFVAAIIFLKSNSVVTATRINAGLGIFGPTIFLIVSLLGITGLACHVNIIKIVIILTGIILVFIGTTVG
jgi:hypothetical protein